MSNPSSPLNPSDISFNQILTSAGSPLFPSESSESRDGCVDVSRDGCIDVMLRAIPLQQAIHTFNQLSKNSPESTEQYLATLGENPSVKKTIWDACLLKEAMLHNCSTGRFFTELHKANISAKEDV